MRTTWQPLSNQTFLMLFVFCFLSSGCVTIDQTTVPTYSDYKLCEFLTREWVTLSDERVAIASELSNRNLTCMGAVPISKSGNI
jgi:hypothetical protein